MTKSAGTAADDPTAMLRTFGARLKWTLARYGERPARLAEKCEVSRAAVGKWFQGSVRDLEAANLFTVARECRVSAEWLATGEGAVTATVSRPGGPQLSAAEADVLRAMRKLPGPMQQHVRALVTEIAAKKC